MTHSDVLAPDVNAKPVKWEWFKQNILDKKFKGWDSNFGTAGSLRSEQKKHPALECYRIEDGPPKKQGTWGETNGVLIQERNLPDAGRPLVFYHAPPNAKPIRKTFKSRSKPAKKGSRTDASV